MFFKMGLSRSEKAEIIELIKETLTTLTEDITLKISNEVSKKIEQKIASIFASYEDKILHLEKEYTALSNKMDALEQYTRSNTIRVYGIPERNNEDTRAVVITSLAGKMNCAIEGQLIDRCHRIRVKNSNVATNKAPPIIVKFVSCTAKDVILKNRRQLKGSGITIAEDLTGYRYKLFRMAIDKIGPKNVWIYNGNIFARYKGNRIAVTTTDDLQLLSN